MSKNVFFFLDIHFQTYSNTYPTRIRIIAEYYTARLQTMNVPYKS